MNSHITMSNKGGVGKSLVAELLCEAVIANGAMATLIEMESDEPRLERLYQQGRALRDDELNFIAMGENDALALMDDPLALTELWNQPAAFALSHAPTVIDVGAQGMGPLSMWLESNDGLKSWKWYQADGQHGRGLTFWLPTDTSPSGEASALLAAQTLRSYLPGAIIIVACNKGATIEIGQRIAAKVADINIVVIPPAPRTVDDIFQALYGRYGIDGLFALLDDKSKIDETATAFCWEAGKVNLAVKAIGIWAQKVMASITPLVALTNETQKESKNPSPKTATELAE
jgi:hypothetical protein